MELKEKVNKRRNLLNHLKKMIYIDDSSLWKTVVYRFKEEGFPALISSQYVIPASALWTYIRTWVNYFRSNKINKGDKVIIQLPKGPAFLIVLMACFWEEICVIIADNQINLKETAIQFGAHAIISQSPENSTITSNEFYMPEKGQANGLNPFAMPINNIRFFIRTSGTMGNPEWIGISNINLASVLYSHIKKLNYKPEARVLSLLPWNHIFGLVLELLISVFLGMEIIIDPDAPKVPDTTANLLEIFEINYISAVPYTIFKLMQSPRGCLALQSLSGGVVGGAPVSNEIAKFLNSTKLVAGYGQTEASPGITLGDVGKWSENYLGKPVGCRILVDQDRVLHFSGTNAHIAKWSDSGLEILNPGRMVNTGDIVYQKRNNYFFTGRANNSFKLSNGFFVYPEYIESKLKSSIDDLLEVLISTVDFHKLIIIYSSKDKKIIQMEDFSKYFEGISNKISKIYFIENNLWIYSSKGNIDRLKMVKFLLTNLDSLESKKSVREIFLG